MFRQLAINVFWQSAKLIGLKHLLLSVRQFVISGASKIHKEINICSKPFGRSCVVAAELCAHITLCIGAPVHLYSWPLFGK
jgi:hypothetical protein